MYSQILVEKIVLPVIPLVQIFFEFLMPVLTSMKKGGGTLKVWLCTFIRAYHISGRKNCLPSPKLISVRDTYILLLLN